MREFFLATNYLFLITRYSKCHQSGNQQNNKSNGLSIGAIDDGEDFEGAEPGNEAR